MRGYGNLLITIASTVIQDLNANFYNIVIYILLYNVGNK